MKFIQIIEFKSSRIDEVNAMLDEWLESSGGTRPSGHAYQCSDRDAENTYMHIVEFPSYHVAMENSTDPDTGKFAARMAELCDGPLSFRNLDVVREME